MIFVTFECWRQRDLRFLVYFERSFGWCLVSSAAHAWRRCASLDSGLRKNKKHVCNDVWLPLERWRHKFSCISVEKVAGFKARKAFESYRAR